jgi:hypothetical protein
MPHSFLVSRTAEHIRGLARNLAVLRQCGGKKQHRALPRKRRLFTVEEIAVRLQGIISPLFECILSVCHSLDYHDVLFYRQAKLIKANYFSSPVVAD